MKKFFLFLITSLFVFSCSVPNMIVVKLEPKNSTDVNGSVVFIEQDNNVILKEDERDELFLRSHIKFSAKTINNDST